MSASSATGSLASVCEFELDDEERGVRLRRETHRAAASSRLAVSNRASEMA